MRRVWLLPAVFVTACFIAFYVSPSGRQTAEHARRTLRSTSFKTGRELNQWTPTPSSNASSCTQVTTWMQCGGKRGPNGASMQDSSVCCPGEAPCTYVSDWYWQCLAGGQGGAGSRPSSNSGCTKVNMWEQCGGKLTPAGSTGMDSTVCCADGTSCRWVNDWYWQCQPGGASSPSPSSPSPMPSPMPAPSSPSPSPAPAGNCSKTAYLWQQCGGKSAPNTANAADPGTCCAQGSTCTFINEWYWQCLPSQQGPSPSPSSPSPDSNCTRTAHVWTQCGGKSSSCGCNNVDSSICCSSGNTCRYVNDWYWQCQPNPLPVSNASCSIQAPLWSQCGGLSSSLLANAADPKICCDPGTSCQYVNDWYWQCKPGGGNSPSYSPAASPSPSFNSSSPPPPMNGTNATNITNGSSPSPSPSPSNGSSNGTGNSSGLSFGFLTPRPSPGPSSFMMPSGSGSSSGSPSPAVTSSAMVREKMEQPAGTSEASVDQQAVITVLEHAGVL